MKRKPSTIRWVVKRGLCTGCGTCVGVCPREASEMVIDRRRGRYIPKIDSQACRKCGLCFEVCPGHSMDFESHGRACFGDIPGHVALGKYLDCYIGYASDPDVRFDGASGGLVTALLTFALKKGLINGALVTRMHPHKPLEPVSFIARTPEEIVLAGRSKYCPVPANRALKRIANSSGKFAVVGLPCHIQGLRKAEQCITRLRERIRYRISLTCSQCFSFQGTRQILQRHEISPADVEELEYRGRGWPGIMLIKTRDGGRTEVPFNDYYPKLAPYVLSRCTLCSDLFGELSDLSCGDAWVPEAVCADRFGSSFVLTRTPEAEELLEAAASDERLVLSGLSVRDLLASQGRAIFKKRKLGARMALFRWMGHRVPQYGQTLLKPVRGDYTDALKFYLARYARSGHPPILHRFFHAASLLKRKNKKEPRST